MIDNGNESRFGGYDSDGITPEELLARLIALQSRLASTMSEVKREDGAIKEKQSKIEQSVEHIGLSVLDIETDMTGIRSNMSSLVLRADSITSSVALIDTRLGAAESVVTQTALAISSKVEMADFNGNRIVSLIEQTAANIKLSALKIDLDGITNVNGDLSIGRAGNYGSKFLRFNDVAYIEANGFGSGGYGEMTFHIGGVNFTETSDFYFPYNNGKSSFHGNIDFKDVNVTNLKVQITFG